MTEVTSYLQSNRLGAPLHRPLAPAPASRAPSFFVPDNPPAMAFTPPPNEPYLGSLRPSLGARSSSVSSTSSSASYSTANSRTLSPALPPREPSAVAAGYIARGQPQSHALRPVYPSQAQSSYLFPSPSQYLPQPGPSQYPACTSAPAPLSYSQAPQHDYRQRLVPVQQLSMPFQYPSTYQPYGTLPYQPPSALLPSYPQLRGSRLQETTPSVLGTATLPLEILRNIVKYLGYLDVIRLSQVNRLLHTRVNPLEVPDEEKTCFLLNAEREYERYSLRATASALGPGQGGRDSGSLSCFHCFKIKGPNEFELFRYNGTERPDGNDARASTPNLQLAPPPPTSNPHYDPSITRSSIMAKAKQAGPVFVDHSSPRVKETMGIRRFCIDCGVRKGYYPPGSSIAVRGDKQGKARRGRKDDKDGKDKWVCRCLKVHTMPFTTKCNNCDSNMPFSQNRQIFRYDTP